MNHDEEIKKLEETSRELRLAEHAFFKETVQGIKKKHRKLFLWIIVAAIGLAAWGILSCPWLHKMGFCFFHH